MKRTIFIADIACEFLELGALIPVLSIMRSIFYYGLDNPTTGQKLTAAYLPTIGFAGLAQSDTFQESSAGKQTVIKIVCSVIDALQQQ